MMIAVRNKYSKTDGLALQFTKESVSKPEIPDDANKLDIWNSLREPYTMTLPWKNFLAHITKYEIEDRNWNIVLKLYEGVVVNEGDWIVMNHEGFYFPITEVLLHAMYDINPPAQ